MSYKGHLVRRVLQTFFALTLMSGMPSAVPAADLLIDEPFGTGYTDDATIGGLSPARTGFDSSAWSGVNLISTKRDVFHRSSGLDHTTVEGETAGLVDVWSDGLSSPGSSSHSVTRLLDYSYADANSMSNVWGCFLFQFSDSVNAYATVVLVDSTYGRNQTFRIAVAQDAGGTITATWGGSSGTSHTSDNLAADTPHLIVWCWTEDTGTYYDPTTVWFDPEPSQIDIAGDTITGSAEIGQGIVLNLSLDTDFGDTFTGLQIGEPGGLTSDNGASIFIDEFRIGESLAALNLSESSGSPIVSNLVATPVLTNTATLRGSLESTGTTATVLSVYWGTSDGGQTPALWDNSYSFGAVSEGTYSHPIAGLYRYADYYYRFYASNDTAAVWATPTETFRTLGAQAFFHDGFHTASSGADYVTDASITNRNPHTDGFDLPEVWVCPELLTAGVIDFVSRSSSLAYPGATIGEAGRVEHFRASGGVNTKTIYRDLAYTALDSEDFYFTFRAQLSAGASFSLKLDDTVYTRDSTFTFTDDGAGTRTFSTTFAGSTADDYSGDVSGVDPSEVHLVILRVINDEDNSYDGTNPSAGSYDAYELWVNPAISGGSATITDLGSPTATGHAILRNLDGGGVAVPFGRLSVTSSLEAGESCSIDEVRLGASLRDILQVSEAGTVFIIR